MSLKYVGKDHYISLITKQLKNELNTSELRELNLWLSASSGNAEMISDFKNIWNSVGTYKSSTTFDVEKAYNDFLKRYGISPSSAPKLGSQVDSSRGTSALRLMLAAITAFAIIFGGFKLADKLKGSVSNETLAAMPISLSPGSTATLAPNSSLYYDKKNFEIRDLQGQLYLELNEGDPNKSLRLDLDDVTAKAQNATLNIQRFKKDKSIIADVADGSVTFKVDDERIVLEQGKRLMYTEGEDLKLIDSDANALSWKKGRLSFDNTPLLEVFDSLEKFYGVEITIVDDSKTDAHFTAINLQPTDLNQCLELLASSIDMNIKRVGLKKIEVSAISPK